MNAIARLRKAALFLALAVFSAGTFIPAGAQSVPSANSPAAKSARVESLKLSPDVPATPVVLPAPDSAAIDNMKRANTGPTLKRLQIGMARPAPATSNADSGALGWVAVDGGYAARWSVTSTDAKALRIGLQVKRSDPGLELRFSGAARPDVVYGPFTEADFNAAAGKTYWSPVLEGDTAIVELFVQGAAAPRGLSARIAEISHLLANPADPKVELQLKASGFCEVNFVCLAASDAALQSTGEAVARMTFVDSGSTFLCTGTLLNSSGGQFVPYFYSADHCIDSQTLASTLTTYWFYESLSCGSDTVNPNYVQVGGGATLLYADMASDVSFMRLNAAPPANATFAGWDAATLSNGTPLTAVHHPAGDVKKVSLGTMGGFITGPDAGPGKTGSYIQSNWNSVSTGVTEGGSSGSGIFTLANGSYSFRGGLLGGPSSCTATSSDLHDWYSRFDLAYQKISQYLGGGVSATNYTALWWNAPANSESGWGINISQQGDIVFATLFTYDASGAPLWLVMSKGDRQGTGDTFSGPLYRTTGSPFNQPFSSSATNVNAVGTMTIAFTGPSSANLSYSVSGTSVSKAITKEVFAATGAAVCGNTTGSRASATNYTDLWFAAPAFSESGWGINLTQQGSIMFATLFTYDTTGQALWLVMSAGQRQADGSFTGPLYRTTGSPFNQSFNSANTTVRSVGTMTLRFSDGENGTLSYTVDGTAVTKAITRQVFSSPTPLCTG